VLIAGKLENDYTIRSEMDGIVYGLSKVRGEMVSAQTPAAIIGDAKHLSWKCR